MEVRFFYLAGQGWGYYFSFYCKQSRFFLILKQLIKKKQKLKSETKMSFISINVYCYCISSLSCVGPNFDLLFSLCLKNISLSACLLVMDFSQPLSNNISTFILKYILRGYRTLG